MRVIHMVVGAFQVNTAILLPENLNQGAIVVDPGGDATDALRFLQDHQVWVSLVLLTHAHIDHVSGLGNLVSSHPETKIAMHPQDLVLYENLGLQAAMFGLDAPETPEISCFLDDNQLIRHGDMSIRVLHTPGHSKGSISFLIQGDTQVLLSGDTLFREGVGRTDLWGGNRHALLSSIQEKLLTLDDGTRVIPGHGPVTTIGHERANNPYLID